MQFYSPASTLKFPVSALKRDGHSRQGLFIANLLESMKTLSLSTLQYMVHILKYTDWAVNSELSAQSQVVADELIGLVSIMGKKWRGQWLGQ